MTPLARRTTSLVFSRFIRMPSHSGVPVPDELSDTTPARFARLPAAYRRTQWQWTIAGISALAMVLCLVAWQTLAHITLAQRAGVQFRAQRNAAALAQRISHAAATGMPIARISRIDEAFEKCLLSEPDIQSIRLLNLSSGSVIARADRAPAVHAHPLEATSEVVINGTARYTVRVSAAWTPGESTSLMQTVWLFLVALASGGCMIYEFMRYRRCRDVIEDKPAAGRARRIEWQRMADDATRRFARVLVATSLGAILAWCLHASAPMFAAITLGAIVGTLLSRGLDRYGLPRFPPIFLCLATGCVLMVLDLPEPWWGIAPVAAGVLLLDTSSADALVPTQRLGAARRFHSGLPGFDAAIATGLLVGGPVWGIALAVAAPAWWMPLLLLVPAAFGAAMSASHGPDRFVRAHAGDLTPTPALVAAVALTGVGLGLVALTPDATSPHALHTFRALNPDWRGMLLCFVIWLVLQIRWHPLHGMTAMLLASVAALSPMLAPDWEIIALVGKAYLLGEAWRAVSRLTGVADWCHRGFWFAVTAIAAGSIWYVVDLLTASAPSSDYAFGMMGLPMLLGAWAIDRWVEWQHDTA